MSNVAVKEKTDLELEAEGKGVLRILDRTGDTKLIWDPENEDEVENARSTFDSLKKKGYAIFRVKGEKGEQGEQMRTFDARAGRLIAVKQLAGG